MEPRRNLAFSARAMELGPDLLALVNARTLMIVAVILVDPKASASTSRRTTGGRVVVIEIGTRANA